MILLVDCSCWHYYRLPIVRPMLNSCFGLHVWNAEIVWLNELWGIQRHCKITIPKLPTKFHRTSSDALVRGQRLCLCWEEFCLGCCWGSGTTRVGSCIAVARTFWTAMLVQWLFVVVEISQNQKRLSNRPKKTVWMDDGNMTISELVATYSELCFNMPRCYSSAWCGIMTWLIMHSWHHTSRWYCRCGWEIVMLTQVPTRPIVQDQFTR